MATLCVLVFAAAVLVSATAGPARAVGAITLLNPGEDIFPDRLGFRTVGTEQRAHLTAVASYDDAASQAVGFFYDVAGANAFRFAGQPAAQGGVFAEIDWLRPIAVFEAASIEIFAGVFSRAFLGLPTTGTISFTRAQLEGQSAADTSAVAIARSAPTVRITNPAFGTDVGSIVTVQGTVTGATRVEIAVAGGVSAGPVPSYTIVNANVVPSGTSFSASVNLPGGGAVAIRARAFNGPEYVADAHIITTGGPALAVNIAGLPLDPAPGDTVTFTVTGSNTGGANAVNPFVTASIPANTTYESGSEQRPAGWTASFQCAGSGPFVANCGAFPVTAIRWSLGSQMVPDSIPGGAVRTFSYRVTVAKPSRASTPPGTPLAAGTPLTAITGGDAENTIPAVEQRNTLLTSSGLSTLKTVSTDTVPPGGELTYTLRVTNVAKTPGNSASALFTSDLLTNTLQTTPSRVTASPGVTCVLLSAPESTVNVQCSKDTFARSETITVSINATVLAGFPAARLRNTFVAGSNTNPNTTSNQTETCIMTCPSPFNLAPIARPGGPYSGRVGDTINFDGSTSSDPDGTVAAYLWFFGDGASAAGPKPSHVYSAAGIYSVQLLIADDKGKAASATTTATITPRPVPAPTPSGASTPPPGPTGTGTTFDVFFAEGTTLDGFREYLLLANPSNSLVPAKVTYSFSDGTTPQIADIGIAAQSRTTIDVITVVGAGREGVSIKVSSSAPLVAERALYFERSLGTVGMVNGSSTVLAASSPRTSWSFAEGSTQSGFQEYLAVQNPGSLPATLALSFGVEGASVREVPFTVPANSRRTLDVNVAIGPVAGHSTLVSSDQPVLVERPMYFARAVGDDATVIVGGHVAFGADPAKTLAFAEGTVLPGFAEFIALANPDRANAATVTLEYFLTNGTTLIRTADVGAGSRRTVRVFDATDPAGVGRNVSDPVSRGIAVKVSTAAAGGILAERPIYFHRQFGGSTTEIIDGHNTPGAARLSRSWAFAEGSTLPGFYPFLTILNPSPAPATAMIRYTPDTGPPVERPIALAGNTRLTVQVFGPASEGGIGAETTGFGIFVNASADVLVERPFYLERGIPGLPVISGGSVVIGQPG